MNTISSLETTDLPAAYHIEQRAHAFPWSEKTFASNQGERYLNFQLTQNGKMAAFAITQVVLDEATLFNIAVDPDYQRQGLGRALLEHLIDELEKRGWIERRESDNDRRRFAAITTPPRTVAKTPSSWRCQSVCKTRWNNEVGLDFL